MVAETSKEVTELYKLWVKCEAYYIKKQRREKPSEKAIRLIEKALNKRSFDQVKGYFKYVYTSTDYWAIHMRGGYTNLENLFRNQNIERRIQASITAAEEASSVPYYIRNDVEWVRIGGKLGYWDVDGKFQPVLEEELNYWKNKKVVD